MNTIPVAERYDSDASFNAFESDDPGHFYSKQNSLRPQMKGRRAYGQNYSKRLDNLHVRMKSQEDTIQEMGRAVNSIAHNLNQIQAQQHKKENEEEERKQFNSKTFFSHNPYTYTYPNSIQHYIPLIVSIGVAVAMIFLVLGIIIGLMLQKSNSGCGSQSPTSFSPYVHPYYPYPPYHSYPLPPPSSSNTKEEK